MHANKVGLSVIVGLTETLRLRVALAKSSHVPDYLRTFLARLVSQNSNRGVRVAQKSRNVNRVSIVHMVHQQVCRSAFPVWGC